MPVQWQVARNIMHKQTQTFVMFWHYLYNPYVKICLIKRRCLQIDVIQYTSKKIYHKKISWFCFSWFFSVPWWKSSPPAETFSCMRFIENQLATICKSKMQSTTQFLLFKCDNPLLIHAFFSFCFGQLVTQNKIHLQTSLHFIPYQMINQFIEKLICRLI